MDQKSRRTQNSDRLERYNGFWPLFLIACSLALILIWEIQVGIASRAKAEQLRDQQLRVVDQARHVQGQLQQLIRGLVDLSETDDAAKRIVTKFGIRVNNPSATPAP